ncbi:hypothetical protein BDBG_16527 [Blastomyces gilchristii SLH14081]|uniref:Uncharacterized protein n=1 Tax=Blastomyces gilchristii (strain SLH14081) TaxID=559298 RepID=A0A179UFB5_BLAGS|nr:uncharacterized protein BDBG_16527 [Blastomyces gilchristii SLH14081]OAT05959.1 hypothetical protein BDBG_16527 [Blastomyces gilchristii SLH14081]
MSFLFKYSTVLQTTKAHERHHRLKEEKKKAFKQEETDHKTCYDALKRLYDITCERLKKKTELTEEKRIEALFRSQMHSMIQDIEKAALLSEHVNLLTTEVEPEAADQEMRDFEAQVDLAEREQWEPSSEKAVERDFEMVIISDEEEEKEKKNEK